jgi:hypothetical protein
MEKLPALAVFARSRSASINDEAPLLRPSRYFIKAVNQIETSKQVFAWILIVRVVIPYHFATRYAYPIRV